MRTGRKFLWIAVWTVMGFAAASGAAAVFLYHRPDAVKRLLENALSSLSGAQVEIGALRYGIAPFEIEAVDVQVRAGEAPDSLILSIHRARAGADFEGPFGRRRLVIRALQIDGPIAELTGEPSILGRLSTPPAASPSSGLADHILSYLLFKEVRFDTLDLSDGRLSWQHPEASLRLDEIRANLRPESGATASSRVEAVSSDGRTRLSIPSAGLSLPQGLSLDGQGVPFEMHIERGNLEGPSVSAGSLALRWTALYRAESGRLSIQSAEGRAKTVSVDTRDFRFVFPLSFELPQGAEVRLEGMRAEVPRFAVRMGEGLDLAGSAAAALGDAREWRLSDLSGAADLDALLGFLPPSERSACGTGLSGTLRLHGSLAARLDETGWRLMPDLQLTVDDGGLSCRVWEDRLRADFRCGAAVKGAFPRPGISAEFTGRGIEFEGPAVSLSGAAANLTVEGVYPVFHVRGVECRIPRFQVRTPKGSVPIQPIDVDAPALRLNVLDRTADLADFVVRIFGREGLRGSLNVSPAGVSGEVGAKDVLALLGGSGLGVLPESWTVEGRDALTGRLAYSPQAGFRGDFDWALKALRFESPDGVFMGEGIGLDVRLRASSDRQRRRIQVDMQAGSKKGEILYDRWYADLARRSVAAAIEAAVLPASALLDVKKASLSASGLFDASFSGTVERFTDAPAGRLAVEVEAPDLAPLVIVFLKEPFQDVLPVLRGLDAAGPSEVSMTLDWAGRDWRAKGFWDWRDGALRLEEMDVELQGLDLRLPVWAAGGGWKGAGGPGRLEGRMSVRKAVFPFGALEDAAWRLEAEPNALHADATIDFSVADGTVRLKGLHMNDLYGEGASLKTSVEMVDLDVGRFLADFWPRPVQGALNGRLDPVIMTQQAIQTTGELRMDLFGGRWVVKDPGARALFTSAPVFRLDARWRDVQLGLLTAGTPFGKMEGLLEGHVNGLEIAAGQPQAFDLLMETVPRKGVPQRISVEAVDSIARIGGGQSPFLGLAGGFASLFQEFPYSKLGIHATLANDLFRIDGTIREDGKEYLVKRRGFAGVNVVNQSPGSAIGFKDMVKRIQRIRSGSGPVID
ncbi:hypothetical protein [Desulfatiglans anilini]|uniref:hypothetical protein n=1 Tax=Desulfatiglans anilini TaxID=90728 RepID=UPI00041E6209|nr:hypothetical protein [Desulfatiglans anilini]